MKHTRLLGIDLIRDVDKNWWILEVNDLPSGLAMCDELASKTAHTTLGGGRTVSRLAELLIEMAMEKPVLILRPPTSVNVSDQFNHAEMDYKLVSQAISDAGAECVVATPGGIHLRNSGKLANCAPFGSVYRRTHVRPDCSPDHRTINPVSAIYVCRDKLRSYHILSDVPIPPVPTMTIDSYVYENKSPSDWLIVKPRYGSGSRGIRRILVNDIDRMIATYSGENIVIQPWIEPDILTDENFNRYYDVRIIVLDGVIVGSNARCSPAPRGGVAANSEIEWLTTLGAVQPVVISKRSDPPKLVAITKSEQDLLEECAYSVSKELDQAAEQLCSNNLGSYGLASKNSSNISRGFPLLIVSAADSESEAWSDKSINKITSCEESVAIADISAETPEWDALKNTTGWNLTPQVLVGSEFFAGSNVIAEAIDSSEIQRAARGSLSCKPYSEVLSSEKFRLQDCPQRHEAEVWSGSTAKNGEFWVTASADGTLLLVSGSWCRSLPIGSGWINAVSISPCASCIIAGTSSAEAYRVVLDGFSIKSVTRLGGHQRWVNGVVSIDSSHSATISSDGATFLWCDAKPIGEKRHSGSGHILGMKQGLENSIYSWSSDGTVERRSVYDLKLLETWTVPTRNYVTVVTQAAINREPHFVAADSDGAVFISGSNSPVFHARDRIWALAANDSIGVIMALTIGRQLIVIRYNQPIRPVEVKRITSKGSPTFAEAIHGTSNFLIGFSDGTVEAINV